jgi:type II secretory pathway component PulJ
MARQDPTQAELEELVALLERRLAIIADTAWRERDPEGQLAELAAVSEAIERFRLAREGTLPPRLEHFLANASLGKALDWSRERLGEC